MPTESAVNSKDVTLFDSPLSMRELTGLLIKHYGLTEGKFDIGVEFQIATGPVGPNDRELVPGVIFGIEKIGLVEARNPSPSSVDAAEISAKTPPKKGRVKTA